MIFSLFIVYVVLMFKFGYVSNILIFSDLANVNKLKQNCYTVNAINKNYSI